MEKQQKYRRNQKKVEMVGDDVGWCFQGPVYISIYRKWGCAKCKNSKNIWKKHQKKLEMVGDDV